MSFHGAKESNELQARLMTEVEDAVSPAEAEAIRQKLEALKRFFGDRIKATYKIEIQFGKKRSMWKPFPGAMSIYLSGTKLHGGGDEKLYLCPSAQCNGIIFPNERLGATVMCRACEMMWPETDLVGELFFHLTPQGWATAVQKMFIRLEHKVDLYLKFHPDDIRYRATLEAARKGGSEELNKARASRGLHIYPMANIIKDTSAGAQLYDRILAFIKA